MCIMFEQSFFQRFQGHFKMIEILGFYHIRQIIQQPEEIVMIVTQISNITFWIAYLGLEKWKQHLILHTQVQLEITH